MKDDAMIVNDIRALMLQKLANGEEEMEEEEAPERSLTDAEKKAVRGFFKAHPSPSDDQVHELAESLKVSPHSLEEYIYTLVGKTAQKHEHVPDENFDQKQLEMGIKVEKEHTDDPEEAKEIAKDHLAELPDYYSRLKKMEAQGEKELGKEGAYVFARGYCDELGRLMK